MIAVACAIEPTRYINDAIYRDVLGGLGKTGDYRKHGTASSSESQIDHGEAFDANFDFESNPVIPKDNELLFSETLTTAPLS